MAVVTCVVVITANWNKSIHCMHVNQLQRRNKLIQIKSEIRNLSSRNFNVIILTILYGIILFETRLFSSFNDQRHARCKMQQKFNNSFLFLSWSIDFPITPFHQAGWSLIGKRTKSCLSDLIAYKDNKTMLKINHSCQHSAKHCLFCIWGTWTGFKVCIFLDTQHHFSPFCCQTGKSLKSLTDKALERERET